MGSSSGIIPASGGGPVGGSDDEAADTNRVQERLPSGGSDEGRAMSDTPAHPLRATSSQPLRTYWASTWEPYFDALFRPRDRSPWIAWKVSTSGDNIAKRLWRLVDFGKVSPVAARMDTVLDCRLEANCEIRINFVGLYHLGRRHGLPSAISRKRHNAFASTI